MDSVVEELQRDLPQGWKVQHPHGGYFLWVVGTHGKLDGFCEWLEQERGVVVLLGSKASPYTYMGKMETGNTSNCFRISIAYYEVDKIVEGCKTLCEALKEFFQ